MHNLVAQKSPELLLTTALCKGVQCRVKVNKDIAHERKSAIFVGGPAKSVASFLFGFKCEVQNFEVNRWL